MAVFYAEPIADLAAGALSTVFYPALINPLLRRRSRRLTPDESPSPY